MLILSPRSRRHVTALRRIKMPFQVTQDWQKARRKVADLLQQLLQCPPFHPEAITQPHPNMRFYAKVRAVCGNPARTDLSGEPPERAVPTGPPQRKTAKLAKTTSYKTWSNLRFSPQGVSTSRS